MSTQTNINLAKWQIALNIMVELIDNGYEYPTAHCKVCAKYELSEEEAARVTEEYDNL